jgi:hypothetical protein
MAADNRVNRALEHDDLNGLRHLAGAGNAEAVEALVETAAERGDVAELHRLAATGSDHATEALADLTDD